MLNHIWSLMCLYHDIGYLYEQQEELTNTCLTVDKFGKIDYGIVGALLLYNRSIRDIEKHKELYKECIIYLGDKRRFSDARKECVQAISYIILQHNVWFASKDKVEDYRRYGLSSLIPKIDQSHRYAIEKNPLLFLLCLLDSIEPIKMEKDLNLSRYGLLGGIDIEINTENRQINIIISNPCCLISILYITP